MNIEDLREIAEAATPGEWEERIDGTNMIDIVHGDATPSHVCKVGKSSAPGVKADAEFIATFNPQKVLELIADLEAAEQKASDYNEEIVASHVRLAAVEKLHHRISDIHSPEEWCSACQKPWPCPTTKAVRGE